MKGTLEKTEKAKYPVYKDSGVEWLGEIPEHWEIKKLKHISDSFPSNVDKHGKVNEKQVRLCNYTDVYKNEFISNEMNFMNATASNEQIQKFSLKIGDIIITKDSETSSDIAVPALVKEKLKNVICGYHLAIVRSHKKVNPHFLFRLFQDKTFNAQFEICSNGITRVGLGSSDLKKGLFLIPPLQEQTAIANFLDQKITLIDQAIAIKQKQIELLKERRQVLIHKAVTRGLNPNVKLKGSGVEWIGEIPEGWEVKKMKYLIQKSFSGGTPSTDKLNYWDGGIPWLSSADIKSDYLAKTNREISIKGLNNSSAKTAPKGSFVFVTRSGILQHTFAVSILEIDMAINQDIKCLILKCSISSEYLLKMIKGNNDRILVEVRQQAATVESIDMDAFFNLEVPVPDIIEQKKISNYITTISLKVETAMDLKQQEIEKLKEYKATLINSAVTGKIKVSEI